MLKKIEAIIREDKLNDVKEALREIGIVGLNVFEIRGHGRQGGITLVGRSGSYQVDMLTKIQLNIILSEQNLEETIETILNAAYTGETGDGLIFVYPGGGGHPHPHPGTGPRGGDVPRRHRRKKASQQDLRPPGKNLHLILCENCLNLLQGSEPNGIILYLG